MLDEWHIGKIGFAILSVAMSYFMEDLDNKI
jgi:hypothetical protein